MQMSRFPRVLSSLCVLFLIATTSPLPAQVILSDSTFTAANWQTVDLAETNASIAFTQLTQGGNPGSFGEITVSGPAGSTYVGIISSVLTYDPSTQGAITSLSFSVDYKQESASGGIPVQLELEQGGNFYLWSNGPFVNNETSWTSYSEVSPISSGGTGLPNFSSSGAPIEFGFGVSMFSFDPVQSTVGLDNLVIQINEAPEPVGWMLMLGSAPLLVLLVRYRDRRHFTACRS
jgi:hypothetical protein